MGEGLLGYCAPCLLGVQVVGAWGWVMARRQRSLGWGMKNVPESASKEDQKVGLNPEGFPSSQRKKQLDAGGSVPSLPHPAVASSAASSGSYKVPQK